MGTFVPVLKEMAVFEKREISEEKLSQEIKKETQK
jgi:hypothetical protein